MNDDRRELHALTGAMFLLSFGLILMELLLTRLFAIVLFAQFAHLALALALLGISVGATLQHLWPTLLPEKGLTRNLAFLALAQAAFTLLAVWASVDFPVTTQFEVPPTTYQERASVRDDLLDPVWFGLLLPVLTVPFVAAGLAFAGTFQRRRAWIGRLYGADLIGGAMGAVLFLPALRLLAGPDLVFFVIGAPLSAAALLAWSAQDRRTLGIAGSALALTLGLAGLSISGTDVLKVRYSAGYAEENVTYSLWTPLTRLSIHEDDKRGAYMLLDNSSASEIVTQPTRREKLAKQAANRAAVFQLHAPGARIAILAASAGPEVAVAQYYGHTGIEAIDIAGEIFDIVADRYGDSPVNPFTQGDTVRVNSDGRAAILHAKRPYDIIQMVHANLWSSAGLLANAWSPSLLETQQAFGTYLDKLSPDGTISFGRGAETDPIVRSAAAALGARGAKEPWRHILYTQSDSRLLLLKKRPWTQEERDKALEVIGAYGLKEVLIDPVAPSLGEVGKKVLSGPVMTDNRPYLDDPTKLWSGLGSMLGNEGDSKGNALSTLYRSMGIQSLFVLIAGLFLVFLPMLRLGPTEMKGLKGVGAGLLYVTGLGFGYLAVETILIHELVLFVGHPTYAVTVVILAMLLFSGIGSALSERLDERRLVSSLRAILLVVLGLGAVQAWVVPELLHAFALGWPVEARLALVFVLLAPLGLVMGMPFPLAMRILPREAGGMVPWAWALNGWMSVVASLSTVLLSRFAGYSLTFTVALAFYLLAFALAPSLPLIRKQQS